MTKQQADTLAHNRHIINVWEHSPDNWMAKLCINGGATSVDIITDDFVRAHLLLRGCLEAFASFELSTPGGK